jgi:hypothetical protein
MSDLFEHRLRESARSLPVPTAPRRVIDDVIARRAAGDRVVLPAAAAPRRGSSWLPVAIAAGILLVGLILRQHPAPLPLGVDANARFLVDYVSISAGLFPRAAFASMPQTAPSAPPLSGINGLSLGGRHFEYRVQYVDSTGKTSPESEGTIRVESATLDSVPVWRVEHHASFAAGGQQRVIGETLYVTRRELRLLTRRVHQNSSLRHNEFTITQRFVDDVVSGEVTADGGIGRPRVRSPIAQRLPSAFGPFLSDALAPVALAGVPITNDWSASASMLGWAVREFDLFYPVTLRVIGSERYGSVDCWKIRVVAGAQQRTQWVRKSDGIALRSVDDATPGPRGRREFVLVNP